MREIHFINLMFGDINNSKAHQNAISAVPLWFLTAAAAHSTPADLSNKMHFSLEIKIMLPLPDHNCMSSINLPGAGLIWPQHKPCCCCPRGPIPLPSTCAGHLPVNRFGLQSRRGTSVGGDSGVKQQGKESICDESEGGEGRLTWGQRDLPLIYSGRKLQSSI